jgi:hypothetical protein
VFDGEPSEWSLNPARRLIVRRMAGRPTRIDCWPLDPSGRVLGAEPVWTHSGEPWHVLGWASSTRFVLWRRHSDRYEVRVVDAADGMEPAGYDVPTRPLACRVGRTGRIEIVRAQDAGLTGVAAWDVERGLLVGNVAGSDDPVRVFRWDGESRTAVEVCWPAGITPVAAAGHGGDVVGLTGFDASGRRVPGVLSLPDAQVCWFTGHAGYSVVDVASTGEHVLAATWVEEEFRYRMLDAAGNRTGELTSVAGLATTLRYARDELHLLGSFESPAVAPTLARWLWRDDEWVPLRHDLAPAPAVGMRWTHRWVPEPGRPPLPEWVYEPTGGPRRGTVLYLHDGPHGRCDQGYDPVIAGLAGRGWTVVGMNYPGSAGYGPDYRERSRGDWGGADAEAVERRVWSLHGRDAGPLCLYGQGYGGYLALLVAGAVPRLVGGVAVLAPMVDLLRLLGEPHPRGLEEDLGDLRFKPRELRARSPISRLAGLAQTSLLVGHARQDSRCPVGQSRQLVRLLEAHARPGGFVRYLEDPRGTRAPSGWDRWTREVADHFAQLDAAPGLALRAASG